VGFGLRFPLSYPTQLLTNPFLYLQVRERTIPLSPQAAGEGSKGVTMSNVFYQEYWIEIRPLPMLCDVPAATALFPLWKFASVSLWPGAQEIGTGRDDIYPLSYSDGRRWGAHPPNRGRSRTDPCVDLDSVAHLLIKDDHVIALQTSILIRKWAAQPPPDLPIPTPAILFAWTAAAFRRQGSGRSLTNHVADYRNCAVKYIVWGGPFLEEGRACAKRFGGALISR
jgi:hypothetical protein